MFGVIDVTDDTAFSTVWITVFKASNTLQHVYSKTFITSLTVFFLACTSNLLNMSRRNTDVWCIKSAIAEFHLGFSVSGLWCDSCWISGSDISI